MKVTYCFNREHAYFKFHVLGPVVQSRIKLTAGLLSILNSVLQLSDAIQSGPGHCTVVLSVPGINQSRRGLNSDGILNDEPFDESKGVFLWDDHSASKEPKYPCPEWIRWYL